MNLLARLRAGNRDINTIDDYISAYNQFAFNGIGYGYAGMNSGTQGITQTLAGQTVEMAANNFVGLSRQAFGANGIVFTCMMVRQLVFSSIRFRWQRMLDGQPSDTFGSADLGLLETPWEGGTTQDLLSKMIQYVDLSGNAYVVKQGNELVLLRPDWVDIVVTPRIELGGENQLGWRKVGYVYTEGGRGSKENSVGLLADEVAHFCPYPDPLADYRGMSWLTPIIREIQADQAMTLHQSKFFEHGATPNMVIKHADNANPEAAMKWAEEMQEKFGGVHNAYKTLNLYPGADATVVGSNLSEIDFAGVRGGGETRVAAAAGLPAVIAGFTEGLESATYSNYAQARRRFADGTMHPLWQNASGSMANIITKPKPPGGGSSGIRLWYDAKDIPFLREDEKDAAAIQKVEAETINSLITAGYKADSVVAAVLAGDWRLLKHSGLMSVQLLPPGAAKPSATGTTTPTGTKDTNGQREEDQALLAATNSVAVHEMLTVTDETNGGTDEAD